MVVPAAAAALAHHTTYTISRQQRSMQPCQVIIIITSSSSSSSSSSSKAGPHSIGVQQWHRPCWVCPAGACLVVVLAGAVSCMLASLLCVKQCWACSVQGCHHTCCSATEILLQVGICY